MAPVMAAEPPVLLVLAHAGGAAHAYQGLAATLSSAAQVRCLDLPGHGRRARQTPLSSMKDLAGTLLTEVAALAGAPWAVLGHSMGAQLAYALACEARRVNLPGPVHLFLSGSAAPGPGPRRPQIAHLPADEFLAKVVDYGLLPAEVTADPGFREYFEPLLRADFLAVEGFDPQETPLDTSATVIYGSQDLSPPEVAGWSRLFSTEVPKAPLPGGHFYLFEQGEALAGMVGETLYRAQDEKRRGLG